MVKYSDQNRHGNIISKINRARHEGLYCDITLTSGNTSLRAHKLILTSVSDYFTSLFKYSDDVCQTCKLDPNVVTEECLEAIVEYAYTGDVEITDDNVQDLLVASNFLQILFISIKCEEYISEHLTSENVVCLLSFSIQHNLPKLFSSVCHYVSENFLSFTLRDNVLLSIPYDDLLYLLKCVDLTVLECGIPAEKPEVHILNLIRLYSEFCELQPDEVKPLLQVVNFSEITQFDAFDMFELWKKKLNGIDVQTLVEQFLVKNYLSGEFKQEGEPQLFNQICRKFSSMCKRVFSNNSLRKGYSYFDNLSVNDRIRKIRIWFGYTPSQLAGISVSYMIGEEKTYGSRKNVPVVTSDQDFFLRENEVIVEVHFCKTAVRVRSLKFISNFGTQYGPYGEERGSIRKVKAPSPNAYLHGIRMENKSKVFENSALVSLNALYFDWIVFVEPSKIRDNIEDEDIQLQTTNCCSTNYERAADIYDSDPR
ncbi:uncharacterized protein [Mytilus edulis]|uniref:BTB domain-containing protein n=1 Tax=Mytilus galloprovincialis TaxID=29158 RepID=A0A8B6BU74_MYTGA|nr:Hypothetical predicted protein [Mytilus galloprovincialis]